MTELLLLAAVGLLAGTLSASLGIGGGIVIVPALVVLASFGQLEAQGTSLAVIVPTAVIGTIVHLRADRVDRAVAVRVGIGGIVGGLIGARVALATDPEILQKLFAVMLVITALRMLRRTRRAPADTA